MGKEAVKFVNRLEDIAAESGRIPKGAIVRWAMHAAIGPYDQFQKPQPSVGVSEACLIVSRHGAVAAAWRNA